jgi:hypothetical protein
VTGHRSVVSAVASLAILGMAGCKYDSSLTMDSAEFDPRVRARDDALVANGSSPAKGTDPNEGVTVLRPGAAGQAERRMFDPLYLLSFPVYVIWDGLLHFALTDTDPSSRPKFETRLTYANAPETPIRDGEKFEVELKYLAIDYFTGGRLRDAWGGQGGQVSVQTSLNALSDAGMLLRDDTKFVVENEVKRRSPLLAIAKGTAKGREFVDEVTNRAKAVLEKAKELELLADKIEGYVQQVQAETGSVARTQKLDELRKKAIETVDAGIAKLFPNADQAQLARQIADSVVKSVFDEIASHLNDPDIDHAADWVKRVAAKAQRHLDQANVVLDYFEKYGVDEEGIFESARIIVDLADADRRSTLEFEHVKPSLFQLGGEAGGGTAATLIGEDLNRIGGRVLDHEYAFTSMETTPERAKANEKSAAPSKPPEVDTKTAAKKGTDTLHPEPRDARIDDPAASNGTVVTSRSLVYRGTLQELSRSMSGVKGFALSFLMIDRGDDRVVQALRLLQHYTDQSGITIGGGGAEIPLSSIVEGLSVLAERISEDKVELRSIDVRFMSEPPRSGSSPGHELFALRPCSLLISRNLNGNKFGAVAEITISRVK